MPTTGTCADDTPRGTPPPELAGGGIPGGLRHAECDGGWMLHDSVTDRTTCAAGDERRTAARVPCPAEITLAWIHAPESPLRFRLLDVGNGGYRIRSSIPLLTGATAVVLRLLPEGKPIEHAVAVAWCRDRGNGYEVGLRRISA